MTSTCETCGCSTSVEIPEAMMLLVRVDYANHAPNPKVYRNVGLFTSEEALARKMQEKVIQYKGGDGEWYPKFEAQALVVIE